MKLNPTFDDVIVGGLFPPAEEGLLK